MKPSYQNRKMSGLFSYYPIEPVKFTSSYEAKMLASLSPFSGQTGYKKNIEQLPKIIDIDSAIGIEVEAEDVHERLVIHPICGWTVVNDPSLRNGGREFISLPSTPKAARHLIAALWAAFRKTPPDFSWRTSIHIHLNMRNEKVSQVVSNILLYILFEDSLFAFVGNDRRQSNFCVPVQETNMAPHLSTLLSGDENLPTVISAWSKYTALNIRPISLNDHGGHGDEGISGGKGTIEFRHLEGTSDCVKVINWINLLLCIQRYSRMTSIEALEERINAITTREQYMALLREVFQEHASLLPVREFPKILYSAIAYVKEMFCPIPDILKLLRASKEKPTGLSEMLKIRTRFKKAEDEKKSIPKGITWSTTSFASAVSDISDIEVTPS